MAKESIDELARRRGFYWVSSEIYGGLSGLYDYGHLGSLMKRKWENLWRSFFLSMDDNFYEIQASQIMPESVFAASGHLKSFVDPLVKCRKCGNAERADSILEEELKESFEGLSPQEMDRILKKHGIKCSKCRGGLEEVGALNMMFPIAIGTGKSSAAYLSPETAQAAYLNFSREFETLRKKLPLGLAIIGKAFRNEISPRNSLLRMREFTQAELQIFFDSAKIDIHEKFEDVRDYKLLLAGHKKKGVEEASCWAALEMFDIPQFYAYHMAKVQQFYLDVIGIPRNKFRFRELSAEERAFYNKIHWDVEIFIDSLGSFKEVGGCHYRTDHDLAGHQKVSKQDLSVHVDGRNILPHVLELSFGVDRNVYALLDISYEEEKDRTVLRFPYLVAPYDAAVFPLVSKDGLPETAEEIKNMLKDSGFVIFHDESGSIGRRYRRMDEIGTPFCITADHESIENKDVTIRDRDTMKQIRIDIKKLPETLKLLLHRKMNFEG